MASIFSSRFIVERGLSGTSLSVEVPAGHVYIVKQITSYASPALGQTSVFFHDGFSNAALFAAFYTLNQSGWQGFYGALVFPPGESFNIHVENTFGEGADVYAGGYDLVAE